MIAPLEPGDLLTVPQALGLVPVGKTTLYALIESGQLPHYRVRAAGAPRGRILIARRDLEAYLAGARHEATREPTAPDVAAIHARVRRSLAQGAGNPGSPAET